MAGRDIGIQVLCTCDDIPLYQTLCGVLYTTVCCTLCAGVFSRNAPHDSRIAWIPSLDGRAGYWDTVKGWGLGMCQVRVRERGRGKE